MAYQVSWYLADRVLLVQISGVISLDELRRVRDDCWTLSESGTQPVHAIVDLSGIESVPHNLNEIAKLMSESKPNSTGFSMLIIKNRVVRFLGETLYQLLRLDMRNADSVEAAGAALALIDRSLSSAQD